MSSLPPFPVDDTTLALIEAAMDPRAHGDPEASQSHLWPLLTMLSQLGGSDTDAVEEELGDNMRVMRDPQYSERCVITALIGEVRRLRKVEPWG